MPARKELPTIDELKSNCTMNLYGCWLWNGAVANGYASLRRGGEHYKGHRLAYELAKGYLPANILLRHRCNRKNCINPDHLIVGTQSENAQDHFRAHPPEGGVHRSGNGYRGKITIDGSTLRMLQLLRSIES